MQRRSAPSAELHRRVLFVSRKYPPARGGMESAAFHLFSELSGVRRTTLVKFGRSNRWLPLVIPLLFARALIHVIRGDVEAILLQDGVLAPVGRVLRALTGKPVLVIIHGLEVTHPGVVFARALDWGLARTDRVIAVSRNTARLVSDRYPHLRVGVATNGVPDRFHRDLDRAQLDARVSDLTGEPLSRIREATILATVGRLVERKGVAWFVAEVMPQLAATAERDYLYLIIGSGPERDEIASAIQAAGLSRSVLLLGGLDDEDLAGVYNRVDALVMPNVPIAGDVEGFGIVGIEAASAGAPVLASDLDGIPDAVRPGGNGRLVPSGDAAAYVEAVRTLASWAPSRQKVREFTLAEFSWRTTAERVSQMIDDVLAERAASQLPSSPRR